MISKLISCQILFFITLGFNLHAAIPQEPNNSCIETEIQGDNAHKDFTTLTTTFIHQELLAAEQKINFYRITKAWQQSYELFKDECLNNNPRCQHHVLLMTMFTDVLKQAILKLQILTVKPLWSTIACKKHVKTLVPRTLTDSESSTIVLNIFAQLHTWYEQQWQQTHINTLVTNQDITNGIYTTLPTDMKRSWLSNLISDNSVYDALTVNLFEEFPSLAHDYIACIITFHSLKHTASTETITQLEQSISTLNHTLQQLKGTMSPCSIQARVLSILDEKLFQISTSGINFAKQLMLIAQKKPDLLALFKRHNCLIQSEAFEKFRIALPTTDRTSIESYLTLTNNFFSNEQPLSESFVYELENVSYHLQHLPENYGRGLLKRGWSGTTPSEQIIEEMCGIITDILARCSTTPAIPASASNSIISYITSGKWLNNGILKQVSQQANGNVILDFASQLIGQKQFSDFKTAALYALVYASPFLLVKLVKFAWPWLNNDLKTQLSEFVGTDAVKNQDSLLTFVSQNPGLIKQVCDKHPEIVDSIAQVLKQQVGG